MIYNNSLTQLSILNISLFVGNLIKPEINSCLTNISEKCSIERCCTLWQSGFFCRHGSHRICESPNLWFNMPCYIFLLIKSTDAIENTIKLQLWFSLWSLCERMIFTCTFNQWNTANCRRCTWVKVIPTFITPQIPTEEDTKVLAYIHYDVYGEILTLQAKNRELFSKTIHRYINPIY